MTTRQLRPVAQSWALPVLERPRRAPPQPLADAPTIVSPDRGCKAQPRCLTCELPACLFDENYGGIHEARRSRYAEIRALSASDPALTRREIAAMFGASERTVSRAFQQEDAA
jgi:AraC-like DNA-binding protein